MVYPPGSLGEAFNRALVLRTAERKSKGKRKSWNAEQRGRDDWPRAWKWIGPTFGNLTRRRCGQRPNGARGCERSNGGELTRTVIPALGPAHPLLRGLYLVYVLLEQTQHRGDQAGDGQALQPRKRESSRGPATPHCRRWQEHHLQAA